MRRLQLWAMSAAVASSLLFAPTLASVHAQTATATPQKVADLKMALRDLLVNHIFWVRSLVVETRLGDKAAAMEADEYGLKNAKAVGQSIQPFYGQAAADKFAALFVGQYSDVKGYMVAAFAKNFKGNPVLEKA